jgi:CheY-like chemotaxis protein
MQKKIVIIDDDQVILEIASEFLKNAGFQVETTDCGLNSNSLIYTNPPPDLILVDVMMPLMSGDKKLKSIKSNRLSRDIPIVLISAKPEEELRNLATACGADGFLTKPFSEPSLIKTVKTYI